MSISSSTSGDNSQVSEIKEEIISEIDDDDI